MQATFWALSFAEWSEAGSWIPEPSHVMHVASGCLHAYHTHVCHWPVLGMPALIFLRMYGGMSLKLAWEMRDMMPHFSFAFKVLRCPSGILWVRFPFMQHHHHHNSAGGLLPHAGDDCVISAFSLELNVPRYQDRTSNRATKAVLITITGWQWQDDDGFGDFGCMIQHIM